MAVIWDCCRITLFYKSGGNRSEFTKVHMGHPLFQKQMFSLFKFEKGGIRNDHCTMHQKAGGRTQRSIFK
ncbi:hypothetical protein PAECIP111893_03789 [Paenibacillus plantiphilus]|uniref:Uncharacterized protein n=1 Tax=Paenibacillus plantiphilus TaxID=2905650 RepID=A0ABN8GUB5_9BACL|nr:hypothetical protein PAECIP111893_03789 [Paenibacillus plantiphilus]